jgi:hypothetical protein
MFYSRMLTDTQAPAFRLLLRRSTWLVGVMAIGLVTALTHSTNSVGGASPRVSRSGSDLALSASACVSNKLGIPSPGTAYAGGVAGGNVSLASRERSYGRSLGVHRTYWSAGQVNSAVKAARSDVAAKRVPWMSFKLPGTWKQMAAGTYDSWALGLIKQLDAVPGPVWIAFWHEPENKSQNVTDWTKMQARLMRLVKNKSDNIATTMIVMGWWQAAGNKPHLKLERLWPGEGLIDIIGMDPYNFYSTESNGRTVSRMSDFRPWFNTFNNFAKAHRARWGVAETGYTNQAAAKDPAWIVRFYKQLIAANGIAMSYFDTTLNTGGYSWPLDDAAKRAQFAKNVKASPKIC